MLFKEDLAQKILLGEKTQTRRPVKPGETLVERDGLKTVLTAAGRIKYQVRRDYAVQTKRGKPGHWYDTKHRTLFGYEQYDWLVADQGQVSAEWIMHRNGVRKMRIRVTDIHQEDVRTISVADSFAEGFYNPYGFLKTWCGFYDEPGLAILELKQSFIMDYGITGVLDERPDELYQGFAYTFELLEASDA